MGHTRVMMTGESSRPAFADIVLVHLSCRGGFLRGVVVNLGSGREFEALRRRESEVVVLAAAVLPGSGEIERRLGTVLGDVGGRQCTKLGRRGGLGRHAKRGRQKNWK